MPSAVRSARRLSSLGNSLTLATLCVLVSTGLLTITLQEFVTDAELAGSIISLTLWESIVDALGGQTRTDAFGRRFADVDSIVPTVIAFSLLTWFLGATAISWRTRQSWRIELSRWGFAGWLWWAIPFLCVLFWSVAMAAGWISIAGVLFVTLPLSISVGVAGWLATFFSLFHAGGKPTPDRIAFGFVGAAALLFAVVFTAMNWQLYRGLWIPHGDSAMYEEHLWNVTHGKGFRSYLDDGRLFLGEHIQVIHLLLVPLHAIWPSQMLLELCESLALASGALPVYWMTRRHSGSAWTGVALAAAYLLYVPMQFLDIAIDLKTFRPIAFGVPLLLFALDQFERGRFVTMSVLLLLVLSAKEDYALILAPLGLWIALFVTNQQSKPALKTRMYGIGLLLFAASYLFVATRVLIPHFRGGAEVHYARYFQQFGDSLGEIGWNMLTNPRLLTSELFTTETAWYAGLLLIPLAGLPLLSPSRLAVALPSFVILCLNEIARDPRHHFHAPLVPILFWAAAAGFARFKSESAKDNAESSVASKRRFAGHFAWCCALSTGVVFSLSPLGISFWDPGSSFHWKRLYLPGKRAELFPRVEKRIPRAARVFSTDFVHPRFTHHARSYDYSDYPRESDRELNDPVPGVEYFIVIDTRHPYSTIQSAEQIPQYREEPDQWELLPDETDGYFIVLRRKTGRR